MKLFALTAASMIVAAGLASSAQAALLNNGLGLVPAKPDVATLTVTTLKYTAANRTLVVEGYPSTITYTNGGTPVNIGTDTNILQISVILSSSNTNPTITSGSILVTGDINGSPTSDETIFASSTPIDFGFGSKQLDFIFGSNTGVVGTGKDIGVHVSDFATVGGLPSVFNFASNFTAGSTSAKIDTWVPEPSALGLLMPAFAMVGRRRRA